MVRKYSNYNHVCLCAYAINNSSVKKYQYLQFTGHMGEVVSTEINKPR